MRLDASSSTESCNLPFGPSKCFENVDEALIGTGNFSRTRSSGLGLRKSVQSDSELPPPNTTCFHPI